MSFQMMASNQWATRPADQRFWDMDELYGAVVNIRDHSKMHRTPEHNLRVEAFGDSLQLVGQTGATAEVSHYAFGQLCGRARNADGTSAPASWLRGVPATLAAQSINHGLKVSERDEREARLLIYQNGGNLVRSISTEMFTPIWNADIVARLRDLGGNWRPAPAYPTHQDGERTRIATAEDVAASLTIREGDTIAPAGLYASAEDMFIFLVDPERVIRDGSAEGLQRGFIVQNAEVSGKLSFRVLTFYLRGVCGNHIIWDASGITEVKVKHVGTAPDKAFHRLSVAVGEYANASAYDAEERIRAAQTREIAGTREEVLDALFSKRSLGLSRKVLEASYDLVEAHPEDGSPRSPWGMAQGLTRYSQTVTANADTRTALDVSAGKVLDLF